MNVLHKDALVLELVTLALEVQRVVKVLVDLGGLSVLLEETTENAHTADPDHLGGEAGLAGTSSLTTSHVSSLSLGLESLVDTGARVDSIGLADHISILDQLAEVSA